MKTIHVVCAIIKQNNLIFATQRGYGDFKDGWEFPGGKYEPGETGEQAIVREIKEELDTDICVDSFLATVDHDYPTFHITMDCYMCSVVKGELKLLEHEAARWVDITDIDSVDWLPADVLVVEKIKEKFLS